jgi:putative Mn2+ efflux pump MntP
MATGALAIAPGTTVTAATMPANGWFETMLFALETHYAENVLLAVLGMLVAVMAYGNHTHNDSIVSWAETSAGNTLSALFGIMVGKRLPQAAGERKS